MDPKILAYIIVALLIGSSVGYFGNNILNESKIAALQITVNNLKADVANLTASLDILKSQNTVLQESLRSLRYQSLANKTVKIGYIASTTKEMEIALPFIKEVIEPDLNEYASNLGYDLRFEIVPKDAEGSPNKHLDWTKWYKEQGINLFVGGGWGSMVDVSLSYVTSNNMVMFSSADSPSFVKKYINGRLFRLNYEKTGSTSAALVEMMSSLGVKSVVVLQRGDSWGDGIYDQFEEAWLARGGTVIGGKVRYEALDRETTDFREYLTQVETKIEGVTVGEGGDKEKVGLLCLSFDEAAEILAQAKDYPILLEVKWFGAHSSPIDTDDLLDPYPNGVGTAQNQVIIDAAGSTAAKVKLFSAKAVYPSSLKWTNLSSRYFEATGQNMSLVAAYTYDAIWILARAVLEAQSVDGLVIGSIVPSIAYDTFGASGWCRLNEYGDRVPPDFDVWGYGYSLSGDVVPIKYGTFSFDTNKVVWDEYALMSPIQPSSLIP